MMHRLALVAAALGLSGCGPTLLSTDVASSVPGLNAWVEYRLLSYDGVNQTTELWGVNRSDERICVGFRSNGGGWSTHEVLPRREMRLLSLGQSPGTGVTRIAHGPGNWACTDAMFAR
jgi:hypothetical protein